MKNLSALICISIALTASAVRAAEALPAMPAIGQPGPELNFWLLASGKRAPHWKDLAGKVVVVDFWATWCTPCIAAFPTLNNLHRDFAGKDVEFFSVTYEPAPHVQEFLKTHPLESTVGIDDSLNAFRNFAAWGIPVIYIFGRDGKLLTAVHPKHLDASLLEKALRGETPDVPQSKPWSDPAGAEAYFAKQQRELRQKYPDYKPSS